MTKTSSAALTVSAQFLEAGQGGIGRVARMTIKALADTTPLRALAVEDRARYRIGPVETEPFHGSRARFALANSLHILQGRKILYDFPGTARAHAPGRLLHRPYAVWIHGYEMWNHLREDYVRAAKAAEVVLVNSRYTLERSEADCGRIPQARLCWLGTEEDEPPQETAVTSGPPVLLFVGRSDELFAKGQDLLVKAWPAVVSKVPDARLVLAGGGVALDRLKQLVRNSPARANIDVLGFVDEAQMARLWRSATAFAMLGCYEGFGLVLIEAMRYGLPVIASTDDASAEVNLDGVTGFNVSRSDRDGLVDRLVLLLSDRYKAGELGQAALRYWSEQFRFSQFRKRLRDALAGWI